MPSMDAKEALLSGFQSQPAPRWSDSDLALLNRKRYNHGAVALKGNRILLVGGFEEKNSSTLRSVEVYDNQKWNKKWQKLNQWRAEHATVIDGSNIFVLGGCNDDGCLDSIEYLDVSEKSPKWKLLSVKLTSKKRGCTAAVVGGYIHIMGGTSSKNADSCLDSVDVFDPRGNRVFKGAPLNTGRYGAASAVVGRTIYVVGGQGSAGSSLDTIESLLLDGSKPKWKECAFKLSTPRVFPAVTVVSRCLVVVGGKSGNQGDLSSVEVVDIERQAVWNLAPLRQARCGCAAVTLKNSRIVVTGGYSSITGIFNSMEVLEIQTLPIQTQITVVERELQQVRKGSSLTNLFGSSKKKLNRSKSASLKTFLKGLKQRADSYDDQDSWQSSCDDDDELPQYDNGRIYAKKRLKDSGQAQVYKGTMEGKDGSKQKVAIKVFKHRSDWDDCKIELVALLRAPGHANVMEILDFYEVPKPAFVMRFVAGGDLRDYLDKKGKMTGKHATDVLSGLGKGLGHLHDNGIVHRDLKSLNVLLEKKGKSHTPVLIDLGLGKAVAPGKNTDEFQTVGCLGTASWMAPEMASSGIWSTKTDMFALGVIMWEVLTGDYPYQGMGWNKVLKFVVHEDGRPDNAGQMSKAKVSKSDQALVNSLWHKDPSRRPSAEDFLARLNKSR